MPRSKLKISLLILLLSGWLQNSIADSLSIKSVMSTAGKTTSDKRPQRGMSMQQVKHQFGNPVRQQAPIGKNPKRRHHHAITRWVYDNFTVVFAEQRVIDTVTLKTNR